MCTTVHTVACIFPQSSGPMSACSYRTIVLDWYSPPFLGLGPSGLQRCKLDDEILLDPDPDPLTAPRPSRVLERETSYSSNTCEMENALLFIPSFS